MNRTIQLLLAAALIAPLASCAETEAPQDQTSNVEEGGHDDGGTEACHSSYSHDRSPETVDGPDNWYTLDGNSACELTETAHQSPIDIPASTLTGATCAEQAVLTLNYAEEAFGDPDACHALKRKTADDTKLSITVGEGEGATKYTLKQFHMHTPSEHVRDGIEAKAEIHFVHQSDDGSLAVVGVLAEVSKACGANAVPDFFDAHTAQLNPYAIMPKDRSEYYAYSGSLTTPPCSEGVSWYVMKNPVCLSEAQFEKINELLPTDSARRVGERGTGVPALNGRTVHSCQ